jgi:hypothetical protein
MKNIIVTTTITAVATTLLVIEVVDPKAMMIPNEGVINTHHQNQKLLLQLTQGQLQRLAAEVLAVTAVLISTNHEYLPHYYLLPPNNINIP